MMMISYSRIVGSSISNKRSVVDYGIVLFQALLSSAAGLTSEKLLKKQEVNPQVCTSW